MLTKNATSWSFLFFLVTQPEILPIINLFDLKKHYLSKCKYYGSVAKDC